MYLLFQPSSFSSCGVASDETGMVLGVSLTAAPPPAVKGAVLTPIGRPMAYKTYAMKYWFLALMTALLPLSSLLWVFILAQRTMVAHRNLRGRGFLPTMAGPRNP
jgi:hypothetical protein